MTSLSGVFMKETLVNGKPARIECLEIDGQIYALTRGAATIVGLEDEWYEDVDDPRSVIAALGRNRTKTDVFTFWQRLPETNPRFEYYTEWDSIAVLPVTTFNHWWSKQIKPETRNLIRKAEKKGVEVREAVYDDAFVRGMTAIFNETPLRQGRRFWHYGKDFETVKQQFSRYIFREHLLGAYHEGELIGFVMLGNAGRFGVIGQIISKLQHRDKSPNNALIAKAVELCERQKLPHLAYAHWGDGSLIGFKRHNGFHEVRLPRYYVPLTRRGGLAIRAGLHRGWRACLPDGIKSRLRVLRTRWLSRTFSSAGPSCRG